MNSTKKNIQKTSGTRNRITDGTQSSSIGEK